jgi:curli biogenesis system outer membrane secretion channel CsgG
MPSELPTPARKEIKMEKHVQFKGIRCLLLLIFLVIIIALPAFGIEQLSTQERNESQSSGSGELKVKPGRKKVATIYEFRSRVPGITSRDATDMFTTALVKSGAFAVAERQQLQKGVEREKQLKTSGKATGKSKGSMLTGADYIFEGTVSEVNTNESKDQTSLSLKGMNVDLSANADCIGLDVRVIEANTGKVIEAVNVRKQIESSGSGISGVGNVLKSLTGKVSNIIPDVNIKKAKKNSLDKALRECIEEAVYKISERLSSD